MRKLRGRPPAVHLYTGTVADFNFAISGLEMATRKMDPCGHVKTDPLTRVGRGESEPAAHRETSPTTAPSVRQSVPSFLVNILGCRARGA